MHKKLIALGAVAAVLAPIGVHIRNVAWADSSLLAAIFPVFGLLAFTLLWLHSISGVFEERLRKMFDFDAFVRWTALAILASIILHPLLLLFLIQFKVGLLFQGHSAPIWLGVIGLVLLLTYDIGKMLKGHAFFARNWNAILIISNTGFILTFFHSLLLGSDLQAGLLRWLWIFYGVTAILAIIYTYAIRPLKLIRKDYQP
jgi:hypothetical protein